ncbi:MAG: hypothetical protein J6S98_00100 [Lentisphaeria bacterium]|nr:hypothetical protein [Lentisphaeria bacterium]
MSKRSKTNRICIYTGFEDQEDVFPDLRTASLLKHVSRVHRNERVRTAVCRDREFRKNGGHHEKSCRRFERF